MKVGVLVEGDSLGALVSEDFGHAPFFLIIDAGTLDFTVVANEFAKADGAGCKVANSIVSLKVDHVVCGGIGTHGMKILKDAGIRVWADLDGCTVEEAVVHVNKRLAFESKFR